MSKVFNMVGGGGGKNISSIIITGLESTDTVNCTKDGKSYAATWDETAKHWEIVGLPLGTFTITATNGTKTITESVLIDIAGVYEVEMSFILWLYKDGDECTDVTGGWTHDGYESFNSITTLSGTKATSYFDLGSKSTTELYALGTKNKINFTGYSTVYCEYSTNNKKAPSIILTAIQSPLSWPDVLIYLTPSTTGTGNNKIMSTSLSSSKELYAMVANLASEPSATTVRIHKIWLE